MEHSLARERQRPVAFFNVEMEKKKATPTKKNEINEIHHLIVLARVLLRVSLEIPGFGWASMGVTEFYWVLPSFTGFYWVLPSFIGFYWVLLGFTGFY